MGSFQLFRPSVAANYASSFRPWTANGGYASVKSDMAKKYLTAIPAANFRAEAEMAKAGLDNYTGVLKTEIANEALKERLQMEIDANKKTALRGMLGRTMAARGGSGGGVSLAGDAGLLGLIPGGAVGDPLSDGVTDMSNIRRLQQLVHGKSPAYRAPASAIVEAGERINGVSVGRGQALQVPEVTVPQAQVAPAPSTRLSQEENESVEAFTLKAIEEMFSPGEEK